MFFCPKLSFVNAAYFWYATKRVNKFMHYIDLHTHTIASDGSDTPKELVEKAAKLGLKAIAITDHDTLGGLDEASVQGKISQVEIIRGCELSVFSECGELHILGLWIKNEAKELEQSLELLRKYRSERNEIMVHRLKKMGLDLDYDGVLKLAGGDTVGRPHIAAALIQKGYVSSIREAFSKYLGSNSKAYEPKKVLTIDEAMHLLDISGATICLAHPGLIKCTQQWLDNLLAHLKTFGLSAIEAYHSSHSEAQEAICVKLAQKHDLDLSGGSDYHGTTKPNIHLGVGNGNLRITTDILDKLKNRRRQKGLPTP